MGYFSAWLRMNARASRAFDRAIPPEMVVDGSRYFRDEFISRFVRAGMRVYDIGSGRFPQFSPNQKAHLKLVVVGLDMESSELAAAPSGSYDEYIAADATKYRGKGDADLVVCHAVLEHVRDVAGALAAIATTLKPGGRAAVFVPCRNALYARMNMLLPEGLKRWMLRRLHVEYQGGGGWPAYYDRCTPRHFRRLAARCGLAVIELRPFYMSSYLMVFFPAWVIWRLWMLFFRAAAGEDAAETFCVCFEKPAHEVAGAA
jgi:SAM-dependent methyltransferase